MQITVLQDDVIRIRATRSREFSQKYSYAVLPVPAGSQRSVTTSTSRVQETANAIELSTGALRVRMDRGSSTVSFLALDGTPIAHDTAGITWRDDAFTVTEFMPQDEHYFGLGDKGETQGRTETDPVAQMSTGQRAGHLRNGGE